MHIDESLLHQRLDDNGGFGNFDILLVIYCARDIAQILHGLSYKVSSVTIRKFGSVVFCFLSLAFSAIFNQSPGCYVAMTSKIGIYHPLCSFFEK